MPNAPEIDSSATQSSPRPTSPVAEGPQAADELLPLVYTELRRLAAAKMASQPAGHTLQATALVHEAYIRLKDSIRKEWADRTHFFAAAAEAMRHILVDSARRKQALRHGGGQQRVTVPDVAAPMEGDDEKLLQVDEALELLRQEDPVKAQVVELRYFGGLTHPEVAEVLGLSEKTVKRYWAYARVWLYQHIQRHTGP